jgi:hypothetical protein
MIAKLQPIKFENVKKIQIFIKPPKEERKIFSPNDLLIAADGNTFYLKDILNFDENVGTGEKITFLTSNGETSYSPNGIKKFYNENGKKLPPDLALHTALAAALNAIQFKHVMRNGKQGRVIKIQLNEGVNPEIRIFDSTNCPTCPISKNNIFFPIVDVTHGKIYETTNFILDWINKNKTDTYGEKVKFDFLKPDLALQSLLDTEFKYCQISNLKNIESLETILEIEKSELRTLENEKIEYKKSVMKNETDIEKYSKQRDEVPKQLSVLRDDKMEVELRRDVFGFNIALNIVAAVVFMLVGFLLPPLVALAAFFAPIVVAAILYQKFLLDDDKVGILSNAIAKKRNAYNLITSLLQINTYDSTTIEKIQTRIEVKKSNVEKINEKMKKIKGIVSVAEDHSIKNDKKGDNKSLAFNPASSINNEELRESRESFRP